jgi:hypothetical protein
MEVVQLQLDLWQSLETAARFPETADLRSLCIVLEQAIAEHPLTEQLEMAGEAMLQISDVYAARSEWMIAGWEYEHNPQDPVVELDAYVELFVQFLHLDVSELFEEPEPVQYPEQRRSPCHDGQSLAGEVDKAALLSLVDELERELNEAELTQQVQELAHDEPIGEWVARIRDFLSQQPSAVVSFPELTQGLEMPWVAVWLGLLHGGEDWQLRQEGEFYEASGIFVAATARGHNQNKIKYPGSDRQGHPDSAHGYRSSWF